jgi:tripartite ATP-independent transporter DctM subunit
MLMALGGLLVMFVLIAMHVPIGVAMALTGVVGVGLLIGFAPGSSLFAIEAAGAIANPDLAVLALFLLMGAFAQSAGLSGDVYRLASAFLGHRRGGLATATVVGCAGFGAVCGSSLATVATMSRVAIPEMRGRGYSPELAAGAVASGGTLGILIPPSVLMVLYGILTEQFIIALFAAALIPGVLAVILYAAAVRVHIWRNPDSGPAGERLTWPERWRVFISAWRALLVATIVSGGIYTGYFTVTEAAAIGASLTIILSLAGGLKKPGFLAALRETAGNTCMIYTVLIGASIFAYFVSLTGAPDELVSWIRQSGMSPIAIIVALMLMYLVMGSVFDTVAAMVITLPFVYPLVTGLGYDPIWWGIVMVMVMEIGMITPPIGLNVFILKGTTTELSLAQIYRGVMPFIGMDLVRLAIVIALPWLSLWLPGYMGFM